MQTANLIEAAKLTDRELARRIGVSQQSANRWRRGEQVPGLDRIDALAEAIGLPAHVLEQAIVEDLKSRVRNVEPTIAEVAVLESGARIAMALGTTALTLRAVAEDCQLPIAQLAYRWRTRDDLARAVFDHALSTATADSLRGVIHAHIDTMVRIGSSALWQLNGIQHAVTLSGSAHELAQIVGECLLGEPAPSARTSSLQSSDHRDVKLRS